LQRCSERSYWEVLKLFRGGAFGEEVRSLGVWHWGDSGTSAHPATLFAPWLPWGKELPPPHTPSSKSSNGSSHCQKCQDFLLGPKLPSIVHIQHCWSTHFPVHRQLSGSHVLPIVNMGTQISSRGGDFPSLKGIAEERLLGHREGPRLLSFRTFTVFHNADPDRRAQEHLHKTKRCWNYREWLLLFTEKLQTQHISFKARRKNCSYVRLCFWRGLRLRGRLETRYKESPYTLYP
jgi:hypothetical protein